MICIFEGKVFYDYGKKRTAGKPLRVYYAFCGLCDRLWKCMEVPVGMWTERGRKFYADLHHLSVGAWTSGNGDGTVRRTCGADKSSVYVPEAVSEWKEMAAAWHCMSDWKYCVDCILFGCFWLDHLLFCEVSDRTESEFWI